MARYIGPVCRLCRREGEKLYLKGARCLSPKCAIEKRNFPPGQHGKDGQFKRNRSTDYLLQLREKTGFAPDLESAIATLEATGLLGAGFGDAFALLTRMLIALRLVAPDSGEPAPASQSLVARRCGHADWPALIAAYDAARMFVAGEWRRVAGLG